MSNAIKTTASLIHTEVSSRCKKFPYGAALEIAHKLNGIQSSNHKKPSAITTKSSVDLADVFEAIEKACSALRDAQNVVDPYSPGSDEYSQLINMSEASSEEEAVDRGHTGGYMFEIYALEHASRTLQQLKI